MCCYSSFNAFLVLGGKVQLKSLIVRSTQSNDQFYPPADMLTWIGEVMKSNHETLRRLDVPASLIPLDRDWHLAYLRFKFNHYQLRTERMIDGQTIYFQPKQAVQFTELTKRIKTVRRLCVDGCLGVSTAGKSVHVMLDKSLTRPFYLSASSLKVRRLDVMWPDASTSSSSSPSSAGPFDAYCFLTIELFLRQVQTLAPRGAQVDYLSSLRVLSGRFALSRKFLEITSDHVKSHFFAIAMKSVMPKLGRVEWTLAPHRSNPCKASFENLVRCANHLFVMLADFGGRVTLVCDRGEAMIARDLLLYLMLNGPGFAGAKLDVYTDNYVVFVSRNRRLAVRIALH